MVRGPELKPMQFQGHLTVFQRRCREVQGRRWYPEEEAQWLGWDGAAQKGMLGSDDAEWDGPSGLPQKGSPGQGGASQGWSESFKSAGTCWSGEESGSTYPQGRENLLEMCLNCPGPGPTPTESDSAPRRALKWPQHYRGRGGHFLTNVRYTNCLALTWPSPSAWAGAGFYLDGAQACGVGARTVGGGVQQLQQIQTSGGPVGFRSLGDNSPHCQPEAQGTGRRQVVSRANPKLRAEPSAESWPCSSWK